MPLVRDEFGLAPRDADDEGLFSRDVNGQLVRVDAPTEEDYNKQVTLQIDGRPITVRLAEPLKDAQGNILQDVNGLTTPRYTTIYDAAAQLKMSEPAGNGKLSIPVLCHQPHMTPVAVCRMCVVQVYGMKVVIPNREIPLIPQVVLDFQIGLLRVCRREFALGESKGKLLQDARAWVNAIMGEV